MISTAVHHIAFLAALSGPFALYFTVRGAPPQIKEVIREYHQS
jgi:hypothetical protein